MLGHNPLFPVYDVGTFLEDKEPDESSGFHSVKEGIYAIGFQETGSSYDNELGVHKAYLNDFEISEALVTNGECMRFIAALDKLEESLKKDLPTLGIKKRQGDYFDILADFKKSSLPKVILFLGSNIGNMTDEIAAQFIYELGSNLTANDKLLLGVDLMKDASIVLPAYNDNAGVTRDFNLNLLSRINRDLGGNFDVRQFGHEPSYAEDEGIARSFLVSLKRQVVYIPSLDMSFEFQKGEKIATEISRKYSDEIIERLIRETDFKVVDKFTDEASYFANFMLTRL